LIVVSDTSAVLNLARINRLDILRALYGEVLIPSAVYEELTDTADDLTAAIDFVSEPWLIVAVAEDRDQVRRFRRDLDRGEAEAIALAIERRADLILVDEKRGRRIAAAAGLTVTGLLGVVARAKRTGLIDQAKPVLDQLIDIARFWIGPELYAEVLEQLGES
jgi:uncharacterized protein